MAASTKTLLGYSVRHFRRFGSFPPVVNRINAEVAVACRCASTDPGQPLRDKGSLTREFKKASLQQGHGKRTSFRTSEDDPTKHSALHEGLYYPVSDDDFQRYMATGLHGKFYSMRRAFGECSMMVRKPALEIMDCIRVSHLSLPVVRYLIYGKHGVGKSTTMAHVMQFCGRQGWLVVHFPWLTRYSENPREIAVSSHNPARVDTPVDSNEWLAYFQKMNDHIIPNMTTLNSYTWSRRETSEAGIPLSELIAFAFSRPKFASDVVGAVLKEIRQQSSLGKIKTLVAIDGANILWQPTTITRLDIYNKKYNPEEISTIHNLRKMLQNDWSGGAVMVTVDKQCAPKDKRHSFLPRYILDKEAIDVLEPHIPVLVDNFTDKEAYSCLEYFMDRKWIQRPEGGTEEARKEILFLSSRNPVAMYDVCARW